MTTFPSSSTPTRTGEVCSPPPGLRVMSTARWLLATNSRASSGLIRLPLPPSSVSKRPRTIRLLRQAAGAGILHPDLEHPAALAAPRSDRLLEPATLDPQRHLMPAEQHHPRGLVASATGIAADLHPVRHATTPSVHLTSQARCCLASEGPWQSPCFPPRADAN